jgi:hypothetical protein
LFIHALAKATIHILGCRRRGSCAINLPAGAAACHGTASTRNIEVARSLGADQIIDSTLTRFEEAVEPVDLVFDTVGGDRLARSLEALRDGGRLVSVAEEPPRERSAARGITAVYCVVEANREQLREIAQQIDGGLRPIIDQSPIGARQAFERSLGTTAPGRLSRARTRWIDAWPADLRRASSSPSTEPNDKGWLPIITIDVAGGSGTPLAATTAYVRADVVTDWRQEVRLSGKGVGGEGL